MKVIKILCLLTYRMLASDCNMDCRCQSQAFQPICDLNTNITYFSPCHGGCKITKNLELGHVSHTYLNTIKLVVNII